MPSASVINLSQTGCIGMAHKAIELIQLLTVQWIKLQNGWSLRCDNDVLIAYSSISHELTDNKLSLGKRIAHASNNIKIWELKCINWDLIQRCDEFRHNTSRNEIHRAVVYFNLWIWCNGNVLNTFGVSTQNPPNQKLYFRYGRHWVTAI